MGSYWALAPDVSLLGNRPAPTRLLAVDSSLLLDLRTTFLLRLPLLLKPMENRFSWISRSTFKSDTRISTGTSLRSQFSSMGYYRRLSTFRSTPGQRIPQAPTLLRW